MPLTLDELKMHLQSARDWLDVLKVAVAAGPIDGVSDEATKKLGRQLEQAINVLSAAATKLAAPAGEGKT